MRKVLALLVAGVLAGSMPAAAFGNATAPTNGGNGAGQSGQCTGNPDDRPASCQSATNKGP
jgi:Spy/CpxP family protein refolding chaperone